MGVNRALNFCFVVLSWLMKKFAVRFTMFGLLASLFVVGVQLYLSQEVSRERTTLIESTWVQTLGSGPRFEAQQIFQIQFKENGTWRSQDARFTHIEGGISYYDSTFASGTYELRSRERLEVVMIAGTCPTNGLCDYLSAGQGEFVLVAGAPRENRYRSEPALAATLCLVPAEHWEATGQTMPIFCFDPLPQPITILP